MHRKFVLPHFCGFLIRFTRIRVVFYLFVTQMGGVLVVVGVCPIRNSFISNQPGHSMINDPNNKLIAGDVNIFFLPSYFLP